MKTPALIALLTLLPLGACAAPGSSSAAAADGAVRFESLARQEQSALARPERRVIRTAPAWIETWARINAHRMPAPPAPAVDFTRDMVVLVALGEKPSSGYAVEVAGVERDGAFLRVRARATQPAAGSEQAAALTHPFHAVRVPRDEGPVEIVVE